MKIKPINYGVFADFDYSILLAQYSKSYFVKTKEKSKKTNKRGEYEWEEVWSGPFIDAITNLTSKDLRFDTTGTYTAKDRKMYSTAKYQDGTNIRLDDNIEYMIQSMNDFAKEANGINVYVLKGEGEGIE